MGTPGKVKFRARPRFNITGAKFDNSLLFIFMFSNKHGDIIIDQWVEY